MRLLRMSSRSVSTSLRQFVIVVLTIFSLVNLIVIVKHHEKIQDSFLSTPSVFGQGIVNDPKESEFFGEENELDGCYHVFLDVGSNIGNTVRF